MSKRILLTDVEIIPKNPEILQKVCVLCLLVFFYMCIAHVLKISFKREKRNSRKFNIAYNKLNLSMMY